MRPSAVTAAITASLATFHAGNAALLPDDTTSIDAEYVRIATLILTAGFRNIPTSERLETLEYWNDTYLIHDHGLPCEYGDRDPIDPYYPLYLYRNGDPDRHCHVAIPAGYADPAWWIALMRAAIERSYNFGRYGNTAGYIPVHLLAWPVPSLADLAYSDLSHPTIVENLATFHAWNIDRMSTDHASIDAEYLRLASLILGPSPSDDDIATLYSWNAGIHIMHDLVHMGITTRLYDPAWWISLLCAAYARVKLERLTHDR